MEVQQPEEDVNKSTSCEKRLMRNESIGKLADHYPHYALLEIKFWISQQSIVPELSDHVIEVFLHSCDYSLQDSKNTILAFYTLRMKLPQVFLDRNMDCVKFASNKMYCVKLPGVTEDGYKVFFISLCDSDPANFLFAELSKFVLMAIEMWLFLEDVYPGIIIVVDSKNFTFSHLKHINIGILRSIFQYYQDALAARLKKIVILNVSTPVDVVLSMAELVINNKLMSLIEKYGKGNTKYLNSVSQNVLPVEYGGTSEMNIKDLQNQTIKQLEDNMEWFEKEDDVLKCLTMKQPRRKSIFENLFNGSNNAAAVPS